MKFLKGNRQRNCLEKSKGLGHDGCCITDRYMKESYDLDSTHSFVSSMCVDELDVIQGMD